MTRSPVARLVLFCLACCFGAPAADAQPRPAFGAGRAPHRGSTQGAPARPRPPRGPGGPPPSAAPEATPSGAIRGRIFGTNGRPLVRAQVQLTHAESGRNLGFASTDEEGRYEFTKLAAGDYRLSAGKVGYLVM